MPFKKIITYILILLAGVLLRQQTFAQGGSIQAITTTLVADQDFLFIRNMVEGNLSNTSYYYFWQKSTNGGTTWTNLTTTYGQKDYREKMTTTGVIMYRRMIFNSSDGASNAVSVTVYPALTGGQVSGSQFITAGSTPATIASTAAATGGTGTFAYQWESSDDEITWTAISGATAATYQAGALSSPKYYRRKVTSGIQKKYSNTIQIAMNVKGNVLTPAATSPTASAGEKSLPAYTTVNPAVLRAITEIDFVKQNATGYETTPANYSYLDYKKTTTYYDGLTRPLQSVEYKGSKSGYDIVNVNSYDNNGDQPIGILPYVAPTTTSNAGTFRIDVATQQPTFFSNLTGGQEAYYYSTQFQDNVMEPKIMKNSLAGKSFSGSNKGARVAVRANLASDNVRIWTVGDNDSDVPVSTGIYAAGMLTVKEYTDEEDNKVLEFTDKNGLRVLKSVQNDGAQQATTDTRTYYVFDALGQLRYELTPLAIKYCTTNNVWNFANATSVLSALCYKYIYDDRGRVIVQYTPGASGPTYIVYDSQSRVVMTQDAKLQANGLGEWLLNFYDEMNRIVMVAIYKNATATRESLQAQQDQATLTTTTTTLSLPAIADLYVNERIAGVPAYTATNSVEVLPGFETENGAITEISIDANAQGTTEQVTVTTASGVTYSGYDPIMSIYYDNYKWKGAGSFSTDYSLNAGGDMNGVSVAPDYGTLGKITGYKVKVLGTGKWLTNTLFYDKYDRTIQAQTENINGGIAIATSVYNFGGDLLNVYTVTKNPKGILKPELRAGVTFEYQNSMLKNSYHTIYTNGTGTVKKVGTYDQDELGRLTDRSLGTLETLHYDYNLQGKLTGINANFAQDKSGGNYFGMQLFYDKGFSGIRRDGKLSGVTWRRKGDPDEWNSYGYTYNNGGSLLKADYTQNTGSNWTTDKADYKMYDVAYDDNGNILQMKQNGTLVGKVKSTIDNLTYTYGNSGYSNQLIKVEDGAGNAQQGDFADDAHVATEYEYDANGNLTKDLNKGITISYNYFLNKPDKITFIADNSKYINFVYDAMGNRLQRIIHEGTNVTTYTYIDDLVYRNDSLLIFSQPEGRVRVNTDGSYVYDYFIKDQLGNTRTVITEETNEIGYKATHEDNPDPKPAIAERDAFIFPQNVDVIPTTNKFYDYQGITNRSFVKLNSTDENRKVGTAKVLRVMAGDVIQVGVQSYYQTNTATNNVPDRLPSEIVNQVVNAILGSVTPIANAHSTLVQGVSSGFILNKDDLNNFVTENNQENLPSTVPKAYLNYILFDDNFNMISGNAIRVSTPGDVMALAGQVNATKNGFLYVYVSNESPNDVYFDNLVVKHTTGHLLQEDSYYPYGLQIRGLSSMALNRLQNNYLFNGIEKISEFDLEVYDAAARNMDPQLGRWWQVDPLAVTMSSHSPYNSMLNDPVNLNDPDGNSPSAGLLFGATMGGMVIGSVVGYMIANNNGYDVKAWAAGGAIIGGLAGYGLSSIDYKSLFGSTNMVGCFTGWDKKFIDDRRGLNLNINLNFAMPHINLPRFRLPEKEKIENNVVRGIPPIVIARVQIAQPAPTPNPVINVGSPNLLPVRPVPVPAPPAHLDIVQRSPDEGNLSGSTLSDQQLQYIQNMVSRIRNAGATNITFTFSTPVTQQNAINARFDDFRGSETINPRTGNRTNHLGNRAPLRTRPLILGVNILPTGFQNIMSQYNQILNGIRRQLPGVQVRGVVNWGAPIGTYRINGR